MDPHRRATWVLSPQNLHLENGVETNAVSEIRSFRSGNDNRESRLWESKDDLRTTTQEIGMSATRPFAIVTGASTGIGFELAKRCAKEGYDLLVAADEPEIEKAAASLRSEGAQ